jgi:serine/threonine protein kinase
MSASLNHTTHPHCPSPAEWQAVILGKVPESRWAEIESHLQSCPHCEARVDSLTESSDTFVRHLCQQPCSPADEPEFRSLHAKLMASPAEYLEGDDEFVGEAIDTQLPRQLGNYELLSVLGLGANGTVYKARHIPLDRIVAIKLLHGDVGLNSDRVARFVSEVRAAGRLDHPHLVRAMDAGVTADCHYLVMEFVEGIDVSALIRRYGPTSLVDACEIIRQTALGLQYLADQGFIHRDVKPSNLLLTANGEVRLLDLGLVRSSTSSLDLDDKANSWAHGTADYMSPEQWQSYNQVDIRADIYSLGCTFFKLLTGFPPYRPLPANCPSKYDAHCRAMIPDLRQFRPDVPERIQRMIERMLAKSPSERYATPGELVEVLGSTVIRADLIELATKSGLKPSRQNRRSIVSLRRLTRRELLLGSIAIIMATTLFAWGRSRQPMSKSPLPLTTKQYQAWRHLKPMQPFDLLSLEADANPILSQSPSEGTTIDANQPHLLNFGQPLVGSFRLRAEFQLPLENATAGLAFKAERLEEASIQRLRFQTVQIVRSKSDRGGQFQLLWSQHQGDLKDQVFELGPSEQLAVAEVVAPPDNSFAVLELHCGEGGLPEVHWCGKQIDPRTWRLTYAGNEQSMVPVARLKNHFRGRIGIFSSGSQFVFRDVRLMYTASGKDSHPGGAVP